MQRTCKKDVIQKTCRKKRGPTNVKMLVYSINVCEIIKSVNVIPSKYRSENKYFEESTTFLFYCRFLNQL